jgi:uncharacterized protein YqjF (DUF2071 family)
MPRAFLTARWHNLILANYAVPEALLTPLLPPGVELDRSDGQCWASLVGFQFLDARVIGIAWPGFRDFPEWNLRFYVRHEGRRGVVFVREFVPQRLVSSVARLIYNEPYRSAPMGMSVTEAGGQVTADYTLTWAGRVHRMTAVGRTPAVRPGPDSVEHFFKEHSWGFGTSHTGRLIRYQVEHPEWDVYPVERFTADLDWATLYGPEWAAMTGVEPASVAFAVGSAVRVYPKGVPV